MLRNIIYPCNLYFKHTVKLKKKDRERDIYNIFFNTFEWKNKRKLLSQLCFNDQN